jgi:UDP-N-acetylmuramoyl-L-alanyl-D-glutamate--2,6-diaminopimelate ligase
VPGRFQGVEAGQNFNVIVDYAHTPDALTNILKALVEIKKTRIITIY